MLKAGKPTTAKERALIAVKETEPTPEQGKAKLKRFNVDMSEELHRKIKAQAAKEGLSLMVNAYIGFLKEHKPREESK